MGECIYRDPPPRDPIPLTAEERDFLRYHFSRCIWTFAKSYAKGRWPHWYTVRDRWWDDPVFLTCYRLVTTKGVVERFGRDRKFSYLYLDGFKYWAFPEPLDTPDLLINRAEVRK